MATTFTVYDIQTHATPSIDPPPQAPTLVVQFHMTHELKVQRRTPEGNVETDYPTVNAPGFQDSFTVPRHVVASFTLFDPYVFFRLSDMEIDPTLSDPLKQRIVDSTYDAAQPYLNTDGIQITVQLKMTTTLELDSSPAMYDLMVSLFGEEAVIMEDGGRSVRRRRRDASNAAAIDGLKTEVLFSNGGGEECAVCLEEFVEGTEVAHMPCSHVFHHKCIVPWLERNHSCPMCRFAASDQ